MESSADWQGLLRTADEVDNTLSEDSRDNTVTTSQTQKQGNYDQVLVQKLLTMASQVSNLLQPVVLNHDDDDGIPLEMRNRVEAALAQLQKLQRVASGD
jgi:CubicO group peptidase (beta-lactamase class C family)